MTNPTTERISSLVRDFASEYATDRIVILGKGASADEIDKSIFSNSFVIALNDAEWIAPADVSIFHEEWVKESIKASGHRSKMYLTSTDFQSNSSISEKLPFEPLGNDTSDLMMSRFLDPNSLVIEELLFLTAFAVAKLVADALGRVQHVYLIGMDFSIDSGFSSKVETKFIPALDTARVAGIEMQQHFLQNALYMLGESRLIATHVGRMSFSGITPTGLNFELGSRRLEDNRAIQTEQEVLITAEITTNHFGDRTRLERLIREAKAAGADFVKFQKRDVSTFYTAEQLEKPYASPFGTTFGDYRAALELDMEDFDFIDRLCTEVEIGWFLSVLDAPSFEFVKNLNPAMIKLPSTISEHKDYLELVAREYSGTLVLSTGMTDQTYEKWVLETFTSQEKIYLLHANSAYPTPEHHCNIGVIRHYTKLSELHPQIIPGWSSHDPGWLGSALAVAAGARMIEKHVKLGNTPWAHFDAVALDLSTNEFKEYVSSIRRAQTIVGTSTKKVTESEHHKYRIPAN